MFLDDSASVALNLCCQGDELLMKTPCSTVTLAYTLMSLFRQDMFFTKADYTTRDGRKRIISLAVAIQQRE